MLGFSLSLSLLPRQLAEKENPGEGTTIYSFVVRLLVFRRQGQPAALFLYIRREDVFH